MRTLAHTSFSCTPEGVAQELAQSLSCGCGHPLCLQDIQKLVRALFCAAGYQAGVYVPTKALDHIGEAVDVLTNSGLPQLPPTGRRRP